MNSYLTVIIATWLGIGTAMFGLAVYALRQGCESNQSYARNHSVHAVLNTVSGRVGFFLLCLIIWPVLVLKFLVGSFGDMFRYLQQLILRRKIARAAENLGSAIGKIVADPCVNPEIKEKLRIEMDLLRCAMLGKVVFTEEEIEKRFENDE